MCFFGGGGGIRSATPKGWAYARKARVGLRRFAVAITPSAKNLPLATFFNASFESQ